MHHVCVKIRHVLIIGLIAFVNSSATAQDGLADRDIAKEVEQILLKRDIGELSNELAAQKPPGTTAELLKRLSIFARAGHRARVHETLRRLAEVNDLKTAGNRYYINQTVLKAIGRDDFVGLKMYFDKIAVDRYEDVLILNPLVLPTT